MNARKSMSEPEQPTDQQIIRLENISKRFGGVLALDDVSFSIAKGEIHAVVGENGAGKSTLMKMLAGVYQPDHGTIQLRDETVSISDPLQARDFGISIVFQELNLFPHLSVSANIFANRELEHGIGLLDKRKMDAESRRILNQMGVHLDPDAKVGKLSVGEKQLVEIARTLQQRSEIIIMDEPNSALNARESDRLFELLRKLREGGLTIIYVSHRLEEVFSIADRISVIRDGHYQGTWNIKDTSIPEIISAMIGHRLEESFPVRGLVPADVPVVMQVREVCKGDALGPISFELKAGEIVGFTGLEGSGIDEIFKILFGLERPTSGEITYSNGAARPKSPFQAIKQGLAMVPANRRDEGLMTNWSIRRNTSLAVLDRLLDRLGLVDRKAERRLATNFVKRLDVATDSVDKRVINLSGGNQQKVVVAKWLATGPTILILNDPTRGIDVGAKSEIYRLCDELAKSGLALLFTSSEVEETIGVCDRVLVLYRGAILKEFARGEATKASVLFWVSGGKEALAAAS
jgi:ABC-type sugar transport system ATPase subunit